MTMQAAAKVSAPSRLHLGLHDCGYATARVFGGVGIAIDGFSTVVESTISDECSLQFDENLCPSERAQTEAAYVSEAASRAIGNVAVNILALAPEHKGFGSKTSLLLAIAQSAYLARGSTLGDNKQQIFSLTGRGGTSGIGVNGFWTGGLIVDGGHPTDQSERQFLPSSKRKPSSMPPLISNHSMPSHWRVQLFYDESAELYEGTVEQDLFQKLMPLPEREVYRTMAATYHGIIPAVIEEDIGALGSALKTLNESGMKKEEVALQSQNTKEFLSAAWENKLAAGLSSFGPTVFGITDKSTKQAEIFDQLGLEYGLVALGTHTFNNHGAIQL